MFCIFSVLIQDSVVYSVFIQHQIRVCCLGVLAASGPCDYLKMDKLQGTLETQVNHQQLSDSCDGAPMESAWEDTHTGTAATSCSKSERTSQGVTGGQVLSTSSSSSWKTPNAIAVQHYQFHSAHHPDAESWLQNTETQMTSAVENTRGSSKEGETRIVEVTQQLCLKAESGLEESQAFRWDEQICYTPCCVDSRSHLISSCCSHSDDRYENNNTENYDNRNQSQPLATYTMHVNNTCNPAYSVVQQSCHADLHYHCLHQADTLLPQRTLNGPFLSAAQNFTPADQHLLGISRKPTELLTSSYNKQGDWALLGQDTSEYQRDGEAAETVEVNNKDQEDGENYSPKCAPSFVLKSEHAPTSPTLSFWIPSTISANMSTIVSPQLLNHHPFLCSMCNRYFTRRSSLNRHMRSHLDIRPFSCNECHMAFSRRYRLSEHMRVHQRYSHSGVPGVTRSGAAAALLPAYETRKEDLA